jgi:CHAT domain-containing protein
MISDRRTNMFQQPVLQRIIAGSLLAICLAAAGCTPPPSSAYESDAGTAPTAKGISIGNNTAGESCTSQPDGNGLDVYCGSWDQPSAQIRKGDAASADALTALAATSPWRAALESSYSCGAPLSAQILDGEPAEILSCTQRIGGWPHVALVAVIGGLAYYADGVAPALPPMQRGIGLLSGKITAGEAGSAPVAATNQELAQRLAAQAYSSGDIGHYESLMQLGSQANQAEDFSSAVIAYRAALALQQEKLGVGNPATVAPMLELALNLSDEGDYAEAESLFATAATLTPASDDPNAAAKLLHYQGLDQLNQNRFGTAIKYLQRAEIAYTATLPPELLQPQPSQTDNTALFSISHIGSSFNLLAEQTRLNSPVTQSALLGAIETLRYEGIAYNGMGNGAASQSAMNTSEEIADANDLDPELLDARLDRTDAFLVSSGGKNRSAFDLLELAATDFSAALPGSLPVAETNLLQAAVLDDEGKSQAALTSCRNGLALLKTLQLGTSSELIGPCLGIFAQAASASPQQADGLHAEMFEAAELAQGNATAREISEAAARLSSSSSNPKVAAAIRAQQDQSAALAALYEQRDQFSKSSASGGATSSKQSLADLDKQIAAANATLQQDDLAEQAAAPNFGQLVQQVVSAKDVLNVLRPDEGFLGITTTPTQTWLFLMHAGNVQVASSDIGESGIAQLVKSVLASAEPTATGLPTYDMADAGKIYQMTLGKFGDHALSMHELVIASSGALLALPFALLPTGAASADNLASAPWLIRQTSLAYVPAAANFVSLRKIEGTSAAQKPWFGFGDFQPVTQAQALGTYSAAACGDSAAEFAGLPPLPDAILELKAGAAIFNAGPADELLADDFTVPNVEAANLKNYRILHFATHALLPTDLPCQDQPAIVTSAPANAATAKDALLTASDVANLHLDANLVILSACNTGGGAAGGEALSGLARSFFYAGARALMVTQWSVNDQVSAYLVADTLSRLQGGADGGPAGALRAAQLALIAGAGNSMPAKLADPFFWAAFAVIGDGGGTGASRLSALSVASQAGL